MKTNIYSPDIECDSCVKVLARALNKIKGVTAYRFKDDHLEITHGKNVSTTSLLKAVRSKGYRANLNPHERPLIRERAQEFLSNKEKYHIEHRMLRYIGIAFLILILLEAAIVLLMNHVRPGFLATYASWLAYLTISIVALGGAIWHFKAYRTTVTCMTGMMIGMTIGMQTGMLIGAILGITNGFFIGATVGMIGASIIGAYIGNCCGIMGILEGLMSGIMGGTMGAMITVMMFNDHIHYFLPIYILLNLIILAGFSYMLFEELVEGKEVTATPIGFGKFITLCTVALVLFTAIIIFAPPSIFMR